MQPDARPYRPARALAALSLLAIGLAVSLWPGHARPAEVPVASIAPGVVTIPVQAGNDLRIRRSRTDGGLSQIRVSHIVQDDQGFLWFGTQHGLNRFDGRDYRLFKHEAGQPGSLSSVFIYALFKDRSGALWVGSDQGLDVYDARTERFRHIRVDDENPIVNHISQDEAGILWLSTVQGLYRLDPSDGRTRRFGHDDAEPSSLASNDIKSTGLDRQGTFWVATGEGLESFDRTSGQVTLRVPLQEPVREFTFHEDATGTFWIIYGSGNGLAQLDRATRTLTRYAIEGGEAGSSGLTGVYALLEARDGTIWLGTMGQGLLRYDPRRHSFTSYRHDPGDLDSLAENRVIALLEDNQQNIWVGLHASPPNMLPAIKPPFETIDTPVSDPKALGERLVNTVFRDSRGVLWFGAGGALGRVDRSTGERKAILPPDGSHFEVLTIAEQPAGTLWFGTLGKGLYRLDQATGEMTSYRHVNGDASSLGSDIVTRIAFDTSGMMWLATWNGLNRFDRTSGRFETFKRNPRSAAEGYFSIAEDALGDLWLGSTAGLHRFTPATRTFRSYLHDPAIPNGLSNNTVNTVLVDRRGTLWVGTQNGLNRLDQDRGAFRTFSTRDGLPGDVVSCILEDQAGALWMSTNHGIARLDTGSMTVTSFSAADGLPGNDLSGWNACHKAADGSMLFGGFAGAVTFDPAQAAKGEERPPLAITDVRLAGARVEPSELHSTEPDNASLVVPSGSGEFGVSFAALRFRDPSAVRYRYRLEGLDTDWREVGSSVRSAAYTALPAGSYRFDVQARTGRSAWTEPGESIAVTVLPHWWDLWPVRVAGACLVAAAAMAAYRARVAQVDRQYTIRLEERISERARIARDLHDSLLQGFQGLILSLQAIRNILPQRPDDAAAMLDVAMDRADAAVVEGRDKVGELRSTAGTDKDLAKALATLKDEISSHDGKPPGFSFIVEGKVRRIDPVTVEEIYQIAREAVRNAVRHAKAGRIEIELSFARKTVIMRVRDDGTGMDTSAAATSGRRGHWGMSGMHERAERIGGRLTIWSQAAAGTEVELAVPLSRNATATTTAAEEALS